MQRAGVRELQPIVVLSQTKIKNRLGHTQLSRHNQCVRIQSENWSRSSSRTSKSSRGFNRPLLFPRERYGVPERLRSFRRRFPPFFRRLAMGAFSQNETRGPGQRHSWRLRPDYPSKMPLLPLFCPDTAFEERSEIIKWRCFLFFRPPSEPPSRMTRKLSHGYNSTEGISLPDTPPCESAFHSCTYL